MDNRQIEGMFLDETGRAWEYRLPAGKRKLVTKSFLADFVKELRAEFNLKENDTGFVNSASTNGYYRALERCCIRHHLEDEIYRYISEGPCEVSDLYDEELLEIAVTYDVITEKELIGEFPDDDDFYLAL